MRCVCLVCLALLLLPCLTQAQSTSAPAADADVPDQPADHGFSEITLTQQNPLSPIEAQHRRYQIAVEPSERYDLAKETFAQLIPDEYTSADQPWGLLVWNSASKSGTPSRGWGPILSKYHLIWIGPNNAGNERPVGVRFGLALDAAFNAQKQFNIDPSRIYTAGVSGGGKIASMLTMIYPEVFSGALSMAGTTFYRPVPVSGDGTKMWQPSFPQPPSNMLDRAKSQARFVLLTGSQDFNRASIQDTYQLGFVQDGFKHVQYTEIPGMGHGIPEAKWVEEAIEALDAPLPLIAKDQFIRAQQLERTGKLADAIAMYSSVVLHGDEATAAKAKAKITDLQPKAAEIPSTPAGAAPAAAAGPSTKPAAAVSQPPSDESAAASLLTVAENFEHNKLYTLATQRLQKILHDYPNTKSAAQAKIALDRIKTEQR